MTLQTEKCAPARPASVWRRAALVLIAGLALAGAAKAADVDGASDHPLIKRYEDAVIIGYHTQAYDEFDIATGPHTSNAAKLTQAQTVEAARRWK